MKQRLLVAAVGVPLLILVLVFLPPLATGLLAAAIAGAAAYELLHTAGKNIPPFVYILTVVTAALTVLALCAYPFLQLGIQYLLYKLTGFLASVIGSPELCGLIKGLGGAFGLILGMVGSCALVLLVSVLASAAVVTA